MEIVKDILKVEEQKGYEEIESLIETEIYLNQTKPDIENILWADGKVEILSTKIIKDKILVNGLVKFKVVYKSNEEELNIYALETNSDFREEIEIEGINEEMAGEVKSSIEYIEYELKDERKVSLSALINLWGKVEQTNLVEIIKEVKEGANLQLLKEKIKYNDVLGREESYALIKEAFEIGEDMPPIEEVLKMDLHPYEKEFSISADRVIVSGVVECSIIYFGGNKLNSVKKEIPFTHFLEMGEIESDSKCQLSMEVVDGEYELRESLEGQLKIIDLEVKVKIAGKLYEQREKEAIIDAYSTSKKINLQTEEISIMENIKDIVDRENISKELKGKEFKEIYAIEGNPSLIESQYVEDKILVEGILSLNIYYLQDGTLEITTLREEIPFKSYITSDELSKGIIIDVETSLEELNYTLRDNVLNVNGTIKNHIFINRERKINIISEIEETEEMINKRNRPSITIYMVQKDDILWDIAKRYNTTVEEIIISNNITSPSTLMPGEKIIIEKKVDIDF
jgi:LysM repeat protein